MLAARTFCRRVVYKVVSGIRCTDKSYLFCSSFFARVFVGGEFSVYSCTLGSSLWNSRNIMDGVVEPKSKNMRTSSRKIGTHDGCFHCDEALACFLLKLLPQYKDYEIVRSRDKKILDDCDIVVDVGGDFDSSRHRYDHHQRTFNESMNSLNSEYPWTTKLSSAGLVYFHFGHQILSEILGVKSTDEMVTIIYKKMYENFLEEIDGIDNGIPACCNTPKYFITTNLSARVKRLNPKWNDKSPDFNAGFEKAMKLVGSEFVEKVLSYSEVWWPAKKIVETTLSKRYDVHSSGEILELKEGVCPWQEHLFSLEKDLNVSPLPKFIIYQDSNGTYRVQCVPVEGQSFTNRLSLPEEWRGVRDEELSKISGIPGCIFVHASRFIGGNKSRDGAVAMAVKTLELQKMKQSIEAHELSG